MRTNQVRPTQYPTPNVSNRFLRSLGIGVKTTQIEWASPDGSRVAETSPSPHLLLSVQLLNRNFDQQKILKIFIKHFLGMPPSSHLSLIHIHSYSAFWSDV